MLGLIIAFYIFVFFCIIGFLAFYRLINNPSWRSDEGDISTEAGYEEDSLGNILAHRDTEAHESLKGVPHQSSTSPSTDGTF
jgi:hypothetical protein